MTIRQYHRNSTLAFPKTAEYACAVTRRRPFDRSDVIVMGASVAGFLALLLWAVLL